MKTNKNIKKETKQIAEIGDLIEIDDEMYLVVDYTEKKPQEFVSNKRLLELRRLILQYIQNNSYQSFLSGNYKIIAKANEIELRRIE